MSAGALASTDLSGDGKTDVIWRQFSGQPLLWLMNGLAAPVEQPLPLAPGNEWQILGTGSFDGFGTPAVVFENAGGQVIIWYLSQGQFYSSCSVSGTVPAGNKFIGIGDLNADDKSDLIWEDGTNHIIVWFMNGCTVSTGTLTGVAPAKATALVTGDFNGDGHADVLWQEPNGSYSVSLLNATKVLSTNALDPAIPADWQLARTPFDFDGDGKTDLVWRLADGSVMISFFGGGATHTNVQITPTSSDEIFGNDFEANSAVPVAALPLNWKLVDAGNFGNNADRNLLFMDETGNSEIWDISGTQLVRAVRFPPSQAAPFAGSTGWVLPVNRPTVTEVNGQVTVAWESVPFVSSYTLYASASSDPANTGTSTLVSGAASFTYSRNDPSFVHARYFSVSGRMPVQQETPPSPEAYLTEFDQVDLGYPGPMTITDVNYDGCIDIVGALGNCRGDFTLFSEAAMGMSALRADGRQWRDMRVADFNGDGIDDAIANVYSWDVPYTDPASHVLLYWGNGDGTFVEDAAISAMNIGGHDETIVVADFDNDGNLDIFLPKYTYYDSSLHNYLLMNDGYGNFTDMADAAGVAMRNIVDNYRPEGAQAADLDGDGRIDLYAGSHLFMNRTTVVGHPLFVDQAAARGLTPNFDEGAKFVDWNNDGNLDLMVLVPWAGPQVWTNNGYSFQPANVMPAVSYNNVDGFNSTDLDGDGRPDLVVGGGCPPGLDYTCEFQGGAHMQPRLFLNRGVNYQQAFFFDDGFNSDSQRPWNDLQTFADFDGNGTMDVATRYMNVNSSGAIVSGNIKILMNRAASAATIHITLLGTNGERNQFGRVVRVSPYAQPGFVMTQIVDGGSGYLANTPYTLQFAAPYPGPYRVDVDLADRLVEATVQAGSDLTVYADGQTAGAKRAATVIMRPLKP